MHPHLLVNRHGVPERYGKVPPAAQVTSASMWQDVWNCFFTQAARRLQIELGFLSVFPHCSQVFDMLPVEVGKCLCISKLDLRIPH